MKTPLSAFVCLAVASVAFAQKIDPPSAKSPDAAMQKRIAEGTAKLREAVGKVLPSLDPMHQADLEIYVKAAEWIVRHQEWFRADFAKQTLAVIDQGLARAASVADGKTPWLNNPAGRSVARGYRSQIDASVQPYGVVYPAGFASDRTKKWRLDVFLHGRDGSLTEVKHLNQHSGRAAPKDQDFVQLNIYGRGNNAFRWAGESDVFEVIEHFLKTEAANGRVGLIDRHRMVLKGFSMGGAGTWHIGLRRPDIFAVVQPGAGFTTTHGYIAKLPERLPDYQEACLRIYDAYRYAENAANVPIVAYSGEKDGQKKAADNIEAELKKLKLSDRMVHLIGPGLEHKFPPEWQKVAETEIRKHAGAGMGRPAMAAKIRFVTYSLQNSKCDWVQIQAFEKQYEAAKAEGTFDGTNYDIGTSNVRALTVLAPTGNALPEKITLDGQAVIAKWSPLEKPVQCQLIKKDEKWESTTQVMSEEALGKHASISGPIDHAFTSPFLCVIGTGKPLHNEIAVAANAQLERFRREWDKYMRGTLIVKKDSEVTAEERKSKNLILFGDPGSNSLIAEAMGKMPFKWTANELAFSDRRYDPKSHLPIAIQPSPFSRSHYVVLNSGHTFHEADFKGTNALLFPKLGDFAIVKPTATKSNPAAFEVIEAGLFDENWQFPKK